MSHKTVVLQPMNLVYTPKDLVELEEYITSFNGVERGVAYVCAYMAWNLACKLTNPENQPAENAEIRAPHCSHISMSSVTDILVENIDVDLLREQRDELLKLISDAIDLPGSYKIETINGVIHLLDCMLDVAAEFAFNEDES